MMPFSVKKNLKQQPKITPPPPPPPPPHTGRGTARNFVVKGVWPLFGCWVGDICNARSPLVVLSTASVVNKQNAELNHNTHQIPTYNREHTTVCHH